MSSDVSAREEPSLAVQLPPVPFFRRRRFLCAFTPVASLAVAGLVALLVVPESPLLLLPFKRLVTLTGSMGAQYHFFEDERVRELLLRHHIRVNVIRQGSIDAVTGNLNSLDFVFTSGQPAAEFLLEQRRAAVSTHRPFVSPIVLATYRDYAETLRAAGVATPEANTGSDQPYYYKLDMVGFLDLVDAKKSWDDLDDHADRVINGNQIFAQTPNVCGSNSGATYVGLVSYVFHNNRLPTTEEEAADFATRIKPLLDQGLPVIEPEIYFVDDGRQYAPIMVLYEHQYLAYQMNHREQSGQLDGDRVLLYPDRTPQAQAIFVALNGTAAKLGDLLVNDPNLRKRALELGQQVLDPTPGWDPNQELSALLAQRRVPVPPRYDTSAKLPKLPLLKKMIEVADGYCQLGPR